MSIALVALAGFVAGLLVAAALVAIFRDRIAEAAARRHLVRAGELLAKGDDAGLDRELRALVGPEIPPQLLARMTALQLATAYRESGLEERVRRPRSVFEDLDDAKGRRK